MTSADVVKALRKSASSLKEVADELAAIPLSVRNYDLPDAFKCVAHTQFYALEDSIYWLELRYQDSTSIRNIRDRLSRLADAEDAFFGADYEKANIDYIRKCQSFREEQIRLAKELEAIADYVAEKAATDSGRFSKVHYGSGAADDGVIAHPPTAQEPQTDGGGPTVTRLRRAGRITRCGSKCLWIRSNCGASINAWRSMIAATARGNIFWSRRTI